MSNLDEIVEYLSNTIELLTDEDVGSDERRFDDAKLCWESCLGFDEAHDNFLQKNKEHLKSNLKKIEEIFALEHLDANELEKYLPDLEHHIKGLSMDIEDYQMDGFWKD